MKPVEALLGPAYFRARARIRRSEFAPPHELDHLQRDLLAPILHEAARSIPFYGDLRPLAAQIRPATALEALSCFPFTHKELVRRRHADLLHPHLRRRALAAATGGSSASPMPFFQDRLTTRQAERAFMWDLWGRAGYHPGDALASFTGNVPPGGRLVHHERLFNRWVFHAFNITDRHLPEIVRALETIDAPFIHGYPSTLSTLARLLERRRITPAIHPRAILCGSERTFPHQRRLLERVFGTRVYTWYGHSEYAVLGGECEHDSAPHLYPQYGLTEFIPSGIRHHSGAELFEIVATGFNNPVMPFIRYRTGDYALPMNTPCTCGRHYPRVSEITGRRQEFLVDGEDNLVSLSALTSLFEKLPFIDEIAFTQDRPGTFTFAICPSRPPDRQELDHLEQTIREATGERLIPRVELVNHIPRAKSGKRRLVTQNLDLEAY